MAVRRYHIPFFEATADTSCRISLTSFFRALYNVGFIYGCGLYRLGINNTCGGRDFLGIF